MTRTTPFGLFALAAALGVASRPVGAQAGELGHFTPALPSLRDFAMPAAPGVYGSAYNYFYSSSRLNDANGDKVSSLTLNPGRGPGVTLGVDAKVDVYSFAPALIWVSPWKVAGARVGASVLPSFATASVGAALSTTARGGRTRHVSADFGAGDLFVQPVWLGWSQPNWDLTAGYGFYAPVGRYKTETVALPGGGAITREAEDNIGLGFWTHQFQGSASWYPWVDRRMAVSGTLTYEINGRKRGFDLTPGRVVTLNWSVSQYLPLGKNGTTLLEVGPAGYDSWQVSDDRGGDALNPGVHDEVHAVGGQVGAIYLPWALSLNAHAFWEVSAKDRFQGTVLGVSLAKKF